MGKLKTVYVRVARFAGDGLNPFSGVFHYHIIKKAELSFDM